MLTKNCRIVIARAKPEANQNIVSALLPALLRTSFTGFLEKTHCSGKLQIL
jgi:hypothetical protein